ncbi:ABC transporter ATP-binding protein [Paenibacillus thiaminolyticus]|uniref:ABC transporter ATP-binding protein n=1 Tax=Paenibacillus thiaminolyticus TaxID=49283 RepID=A0AAJ1G251_PANTH|nr:ABC transporter ATP-binding protein [Paenibacillus thiaminolyticus]MCY9533947.1 ABC transporter ATP-binding protein [Paenibacillus thiaminolyticus]MCY9601910.1 ABC transporter ATP-binding protein [Paenibacillus thiaminolyticus]MCY9606958.1 ABC transporter ATP-binding protein [Paenibacillus thiaminolyticus]MCY9614354.1 ABC transporter ATP-binding protein [Paenibacillus thiaminolyticus]MCY9619089.1 ABC transporter ATP-binding protein [Paenibacillus thiaminolyticus]
MIHCEGLVKIYKTDDIEVVALQGLNLTVKQGELMAIIGNSGSGKSTLLNTLGGLDRPSAGTVRVGKWDLLKITDEQLVEYKRDTVGFIWQNNARNLLPYLTALENVEVPMMLGGKMDRAYAKELLEAVGLGHRMNNKLHQLSGGEQQRVAIAISLANRPQLLLADEPTGSVDTQTSDMIMDIFRRMNREMGVTVVIVTHDLTLAGKVDRVVAIRDGLTSTEFIKRNPNLDEGEDQGFAGQGLQDHHEAYVVVDRVGRLQVPKEYLEALHITDKASMEIDGDKIIIRTPKELEG